MTVDSLPPRVIFIDLDGTLFQDDLTISALDQSAILRAEQAGIEVVFASGRPVQSIAQTVSKLGAGRYVIASNGGCVIDLKQDTVLDYSGINRRLILAVADAAYQSGATPTVYSPTKWFAERLDENVAIEQDRANVDPEVRGFASIHDPIIKILNIGDREPLLQLEARLQQFKDDLEWFYTYPEYLEVMRKGVSKGQARDFLVGHLGFSRHDTLAIGDGMNDLSLIQGAGFGVAMSNGRRELIESADYIAPSNNENGVAAAIHGLVFHLPEYLEQLTPNSDQDSF